MDISGINGRATPMVSRPVAGCPQAARSCQYRTSISQRSLAENPLAQFIFNTILPSPNRSSAYYHYFTGERTDGTNFANDGTNAYAARGVTNVDNRYSIRLEHAITPSDQTESTLHDGACEGVRYNALGLSSPADEVATDANYFPQCVPQLFAFLPERRDAMNFVPRSCAAIGIVGRYPPALSQDWAATMSQLLPAEVFTRPHWGQDFPRWQGLRPAGESAVAAHITDGGRSIDQNFGLADDFSLVRGAHTIKFGLDTRMMQLNRNDNSYLSGGGYNFNAGTTSPTPSATRWQYDGFLCAGGDQSLHCEAGGITFLLPMEVLCGLRAGRLESSVQSDLEYRS